MKLRCVAYGALVVSLFAACSSDPPKVSLDASPSSRVSTTTGPADSCDGSTTPEIDLCIHKAFLKLDKERVRLADRLVAEAIQPEPLQPFTGTLPNLKSTWRQSEAEFVVYRDTTCDAAFVARYPGTWASIDESNCEISLDQTRIAFLRAALDGKGNWP